MQRHCHQALVQTSAKAQLNGNESPTERWAVTSTLFAAGNARADKEEALVLELFGAANSVRVMRVAAINDDVALLQMRFDGLDEVIDRRPGLDEQDNLSRRLQDGAELFDGFCADNV